VSTNIFHSNLSDARKNYKFQEILDYLYRIFSFGIFSNKKNLEKAKEDYTNKLSEYFRYEKIQSRTELLDKLPNIEFLDGIRLGQDTNSEIPVIGREDYGNDWEIIRQAILLRDSHQCQESDGYCSGVLQVHHIIPLTKGGTNQSFNLITLCFYHHSLKHDHMKNRL
jgi:hypothetical protein